jgi:hypothetical protein
VIKANRVNASFVGHALTFFIKGKLPPVSRARPIATFSKPTLCQIGALVGAVAVN